MRERLRSATPNEYYEATGRIDQIFEQIGSANGIAVFSEQIPRRVSIKMDALSVAANPYDKTTGQQMQDMPQMKRVFNLGGGAGLLLARFAYEPQDITMDASTIFRAPIPLGVSRGGIQAERHRAFARSIFELGKAGVELAGAETAEWLTEQGDQLFGDVIFSHFFVSSAGIIIGMADQALHREESARYQKDMEQFERQLEGV
jgi:hypothetical protein